MWSGTRHVLAASVLYVCLKTLKRKKEKENKDPTWSLNKNVNELKYEGKLNFQSNYKCNYELNSEELST